MHCRRMSNRMRCTLAARATAMLSRRERRRCNPSWHHPPCLAAMRHRLPALGCGSTQFGFPEPYFSIKVSSRSKPAISLSTALSRGGLITKIQYCHIKQLVINLDNGPQNSSHRTQFMKRMIEFAAKNNLKSC